MYVYHFTNGKIKNNSKIENRGLMSRMSAKNFKMYRKVTEGTQELLKMVFTYKVDKCLV